MAESANKPGMQFRSALLKLSNQLSTKDLAEMKFLVAGLPEKPGFAELEKVDNSMAFFTVLIQHSLISEDNYDLLEYLLKEIKQTALFMQFKEDLKNGKC